MMCFLTEIILFTFSSKKVFVTITTLAWLCVSVLTKYISICYDDCFSLLFRNWHILALVWTIVVWSMDNCVCATL